MNKIFGFGALLVALAVTPAVNAATIYDLTVNGCSGTGGCGTKCRSRDPQLPGLERSRGVSRGCWRAGDFHQTAGPDRRRSGAGGERHLLRHNGHQSRGSRLQPAQSA